MRPKLMTQLSKEHVYNVLPLKALLIQIYIVSICVNVWLKTVCYRTGNRLEEYNEYLGINMASSRWQ